MFNDGYKNRFNPDIHTFLVLGGDEWSKETSKKEIFLNTLSRNMDSYVTGHRTLHRNGNKGQNIALSTLAFVSQVQEKGSANKFLIPKILESRNPLGFLAHGTLRTYS